MTKEQFISGTSFYIRGKKYNGDSTYYFNEDHIRKQIRSSIEESIILEDHECNVDKVGRLGFTGYTYVMGKRVVVKLKFADLVEFQSEEA
jgi:hypothetical protein